MSERAAYLRDGTAIYERSFAIIRAEADLSRFSAEEADVAVRMIHACGEVEVAQHIVFGANLVAAARGALAAGAPILCDAEMVAHGITRARLPARNDVICTLNDPRVPALAKKLRHDALGGGARIVARSARRRSGRHRQCADGVVPAAGASRRRRAEAGGHPRHSGRLRRRRRIEGRARRRSARRAVSDRARAHRRQRHDGRRRQCAGEGRAMSARQRGKADRRRRRAGRSGADDAQGHARARAKPTSSRISPKPETQATRAPSRRSICAPEVIELPLAYPVTTELPKCSNGYRDALRDFYDEAAATIAAHLEAGRIVAVICEGDPLFYGSYMHLHTRLAPRFPTEIVAGVTGMSGCWSAAGMPIAQGDDVFTVLPATLAGRRARAAACRRRRRRGDEGRTASAETAPRAASAAAGCRAPSMSSAAPWRMRR